MGSLWGCKGDRARIKREEEAVGLGKRGGRNKRVGGLREEVGHMNSAGGF